MDIPRGIRGKLSCQSSIVCRQKHICKTSYNHQFLQTSHFEAMTASATENKAAAGEHEVQQQGVHLKRKLTLYNGVAIIVAEFPDFLD
ncbi:hypothetical protein B566_EDAN009020, partial [Ephemera danica]